MNHRSKLMTKIAAVCAIVAGLAALPSHHGFSAWGLAGVAVGVAVGVLILAVRRRI